MPDYARSIVVSESEVRSVIEAWGLSSMQQQMALQLPWIVDGVVRYEMDALLSMSRLAQGARGTFPIAIETPWIQDGLNDVEIRAFNAIGSIQRDYSDTVIRVIFDKPWARDGFDFPEASAIVGLQQISHHQPETVIRSILEMPFLDTVEPADALAIHALKEWALYAPTEFHRVWNHPNIADGITDKESRLVVQIIGVYGGDPQELLLQMELTSADQIEVEKREIQLPLSGEISIRIFRSVPGSPCTMDSLEQILLMLEELISVPFPVRHVNFVFTAAPDSSAYWYNSVDYVYGWQESTVTENCFQDAGYIGYESVYAHEMAHYYWLGGHAWIEEGLADFIRDVRFTALRGVWIMPYRPNTCTEFANIAELELAKSNPFSVGIRCDYILGNLLFHDLYRNIDHDSFRQSFRHLYLLSRFDDPDDRCEGTWLNVCHVREAFTKFVPANTAEDVQALIDKWYFGDFPRYWTDGMPWISGVVTGSDGKPLKDLELAVHAGDAYWSTVTDDNGEFSFSWRMGTFNLEILQPKGCQFARWYDGQGLTSDRQNATDLIVDGRSLLAPIKIQVSSKDISCVP